MHSKNVIDYNSKNIIDKNNIFIISLTAEKYIIFLLLPITKKQKEKIRIFPLSVISVRKKILIFIVNQFYLCRSSKQ